MSMVTRLRSKTSQEMAEATKIVDGKIQQSKQALGDTKEKRRAFGDIVNRLGSGIHTSQEEKQKLLGANYKDVKPRVDTRWKKPEVAVQRISKATTISTTTAALPKPVLQRQPSKPNTIARMAEELKKNTEAKNAPKLKKEPNEELLIKSPGSFKPKKEKVVINTKNFYKSHSSKLLLQIENIDSKDGENPQLLSEYVNDIYAYLFKVERIFPIRENFLATQTDVTPKMRTVLLDWINEVHNQFSLELETYHMTVSMIDRYLQATTTTPRRNLQLIGVTALFMASKYEELMPPEISDFVYVTDDTYSKEQILQMEKKIFETLQFNLAKPLPIHFLRRFAKAAGPLADRQYIAAKYFMELASLDYELTKYNPSQIAATSLYLSLYIFNSIRSDDDLWTPTLEHYTTYTSDDLMPIMKRLAIAVAAAKDVKLKAVFTKYSHAVYKFTSTLPDMNGIKINQIIKQD